MSAGVEALMQNRDRLSSLSIPVTRSDKRGTKSLGRSQDNWRKETASPVGHFISLLFLKKKFSHPRESVSSFSNWLQPVRTSYKWLWNTFKMTKACVKSFQLHFLQTATLIHTTLLSETIASLRRYAQFWNLCRIKSSFDCTSCWFGQLRMANDIKRDDDDDDGQTDTLWPF